MYSNLERYVADRKPPLGAVLNPYLSINQGLVFFPPFNEGSGNKVFDLSGNNKTGILEGNASWDVGFVVCEAGGDKISMDTPALEQAGTIAFSFNGTGTPARFGKLLAAGDGTEFQLYRGDRDDRLVLYINGTASTNFTAPISFWGTGENIIVATWDASKNERSVYFNGVIISTLIGAFTWDAPGLPTDFYIGDNSNNNRTAGGRFVWVSAYNRALNASEIAELYLEPFCGFRWTSIEQLAAYIAEEPPPEIKALFMDLSTQLWTIKHSTGIFTRL